MDSTKKVVSTRLAIIQQQLEDAYICCVDCSISSNVAPLLSSFSNAFEAFDTERKRISFLEKMDITLHQ